LDFAKYFGFVKGLRGVFIKLDCTFSSKVDGSTSSRFKKWNHQLWMRMYNQA